MKLKFILDKEYEKEIIEDKKYYKFVDQQHKILSKYLKNTVIAYQSSWDEINDKFSKYIEERTGYQWYYNEYKCVVSVIHQGISNWGHAPIVVRTWEENPYSMRRITAHEIILSHYFEIYRRNYSDRKLKDTQVWALAEIAAFALTSLDKEVVNKFWPWNVEYYTNHNYPQIVDIQLKLKSVFIKNKDFNKYIEKGIEIIKDYPKIGPF